MTFILKTLTYPKRLYTEYHSDRGIKEKYDHGLNLYVPPFKR